VRRDPAGQRHGQAREHQREPVEQPGVRQAADGDNDEQREAGGRFGESQHGIGQAHCEQPRRDGEQQHAGYAQQPRGLEEIGEHHDT
jgi:hypothetical protein